MAETNYQLNPILHNSGGRSVPYEKYHLTEEEHEKATQLATGTQDGLMPSDKVGAVEIVDPPIHPDDPGEIGQRAYDDNYVYYYTLDGWKRAELEEFNNSSSSSST